MCCMFRLDALRYLLIQLNILCIGAILIETFCYIRIDSDIIHYNAANRTLHGR